MKKVLALASLVFALAPHSRAQQPTSQPMPQPTPPAQTQPTPVPPEAHEYAPIKERELSYKNWTFKRAASGESLNLRDWVRGKKLVLVVYFAPWCRNWKLEAPVVARLYQKYRDAGLDVVAVSDYGADAEIKAFFDEHPAPYTVVVESTTADVREKTAHYGYRHETGDTRKWGSPYNVFLDSTQLNERGDVLAAKVWVANGELVEADAERFIRERLGLPAEDRIEH
ncbi:MAG: redoxin domain-containing protein [Pyrinomonadaceae bacterium]